MNPRPSFIAHRLSTVATCCIALASSCILAGCNIVGPAMMLIEGPPTNEAQFELPPEKSVIFFIDDRGNKLPRRALRQVIAEQAQNTLLAKQKQRRVIDTRAAVAVAARETESEPMDIVTIGRTVQADLIIYVTIDLFTLTPDGVNFLPQATARVKVLDTSRDADPRLWPADPEGQTLRLSPNQRSSPMPQSAAEQTKSEIAFASKLGDAVAKVFFEHESRESVRQ